MKKCVLGLFIVSMMMIGLIGNEVQASSTIENVKLMIDGQYEDPEVSARIANSRTYVPLRFISEKMGTDVLWDSATSSIHISQGSTNTKIEMKLGSKQVKVNGKLSEMDVAPFIDQARTLVPIRFVSEYLGLTVGWDAQERTAIVSKPFKLVLNGQAMSKPYEPIKIKDKMYFPLFEVAKQLNLEVTEKTSENKYSFAYYASNEESSDEPIQNIEIIRRDVPISEIVTLEGTKMVSYEWVEHVLGNHVNWMDTKEVHINRLNVLRQINFQDGVFSLDLSSISTKNINTFFLRSPHRLVVDIPHTALSEELTLSQGEKVFPIHEGTVEQVRVALTSDSPSTVRIVFDLNTRSKVTLDYLPNLIYLQLEERKPLVVIDPGHGGKDPGAIGKNSKEAQVVLDISLKIKKLLEDDPNIDAIITRDTDRYLTLDERVEIANQANADLFLSVHANALPNKSSVGGTETFIYYNSDQTFGSIVHKYLIKATGLTDRGLKEAGFKVIRTTEMPAALIEIAFLSNPNEEKLLNNPQFQDKVALAMYNAIKEYEFGE